MPKALPPEPNLDFLKREAKRRLRAVRDGDSQATAVLRQLPKFRDAGADHVRSTANLADMQHVVALEYGFAGWTALKAHVEAQTPRLGPVRPVLKIGSFAEAKTHYVDWLGFALDWEWREAPGEPTIAAFSRDACAFMVNEYPDAPGPTTLHLDVRNLGALAGEWNERRPGSVKARIELPYEFPDLPIRDPWGNTLVFEDKDEAAQQRKIDAVRPKMRRFIEERLAAGFEIPTPEEVREAVGPPLGTAVEVLNEFPEYAAAYAARRKEGSSDDR